MTIDPPIYINVRDRLTPLRQLIDWLERAGHQRIVLLDNDSTYEPLRDYLERTPHEVRTLRRNLGSLALWLSGKVPNEPFVYTDPDVVPIKDCPLDAVQHLARLLGSSPYPKAALGLYLDDLPASLPCLPWERSLVGIPSDEFPNPQGREIQPGVFATLSDTTFALYRAGCSFTLQALRTGYPYQARHLPWYVPENELTDEDRYYLDRAKAGAGGSSWAEGKNWPRAA